MDKARAKINEEFKKNKNVQNEAEIPALISIAKDVEFFYRTQVVQAVEVEQGKHSRRFVIQFYFEIPLNSFAIVL